MRCIGLPCFGADSISRTNSEAGSRTIVPLHFAEFIENLRRADSNAVRVFLETYRPIVRSAVEGKLAGTSLQRTCDASDICQDVLPAFLRRLQNVDLPRLEFEVPEKLDAYLRQMAVNQLADARRREKVRGGDRRVDWQANTKSSVLYEALVKDSGESPSQTARDHEIIAELKQRIAPDLLPVLELRLQSFTWGEVAARLGLSAHATRTRFTREVRKRLREIDPGIFPGIGG
jgi:RNA polymerase sigma factor (sigma-70 family)